MALFNTIRKSSQAVEDYLKENMSEIDMAYEMSKQAEVNPATVLGARPTPMADFYQSKVRPAIANTWQSDKSIETLGQTPLKATPIYSAAQAGKGIVGMGGRVLESMFSGLTGGSPENYAMSNRVANSIQKGALNEDELAFLKNLDDEFYTSVGGMTGSVASTWKIKPGDLKQIQKQYNRIQEYVAYGNYDYARKLSEALPDKEQKAMLTALNEMDPNYVSKAGKKVKHLRNAIGNRYAGSERITSLADTKN